MGTHRRKSLLAKAEPSPARLRGGENLRIRHVSILAFVLLLAPPALVGAAEVRDAPDAVALGIVPQQDLASPLSHDNSLVPDGTTFTTPCQYVDPTALGRVRPSLSVGVNNLGSFINPGVGGAGAVGFQVPAGAASESLADGWWGEGWLVDFGLGAGSYYPHGPMVGPVERIDDHWTDSGSYIRYVATVFLPIREGSASSSAGVLVDFEFVVDKRTCDVVLRTTIENQAGMDLPVYYKRVIDWDVIYPTILAFPNCWESIPGGVRAFVPNLPNDCKSGATAECRTTALGLQPDVVDFNAWDDLGLPNPGFVQAAPVPQLADWNAGFSWTRTLDAHDRWTTFLRYECSDFGSPIIVTPVDPRRDVLRAVEDLLAKVLG